MGSWNLQKHLNSNLFWPGDSRFCGHFPPFAFLRRGCGLVSFQVFMHLRTAFLDSEAHILNYKKSATLNPKKLQSLHHTISGLTLLSENSKCFKDMAWNYKLLLGVRSGAKINLLSGHLLHCCGSQEGLLSVVKCGVLGPIPSGYDPDDGSEEGVQIPVRDRNDDADTLLQSTHPNFYHSVISIFDCRWRSVYIDSTIENKMTIETSIW